MEATIIMQRRELAILACIQSNDMPWYITRDRRLFLETTSMYKKRTDAPDLQTYCGPHTPKNP